MYYYKAVQKAMVASKYDECFHLYQCFILYEYYVSKLLHYETNMTETSIWIFSTRLKFMLLFGT